MDIFLIDAIGPFFQSYSKRRINWSKIPFQELCLDQPERRNQFDQIARDMETFARRVSTVGFNSVSLDDVAHLAPDKWYEPEINRIIHVFREEYQTLFSILQTYELDIYLTMDVLSFTPQIKRMIAGNRKKGVQLVHRQVESIFSYFPEIKGIIFRIGECDGKDVNGNFKSELFLRSSRQVNLLLRELLPLFESYKRTLILRNWTIGAYPVGDFIWHRRTTARVLKGIDSPNFILSMKYGESDFFRYLPLNKHFFQFKVKKIVELQTRREYEGCGEYPSFIGWDYQYYARQLESAANIVGISVWCQTGGWLPFRRRTYLETSGIWNELNSYVTLKIFKERVSVEQAVHSYCSQIDCNDPNAFLELLRLDDEVIKELLYIKEVAEQKLFFRRVRIPPLLSVYWNTIFINESTRCVLLSLVKSPEESVKKGYEALKKIEAMKQIAEDLNLPVDDLQFMADTFEILALARSYYFLPDNGKEQQKIKKAKRSYKKRYPREYRPRYRIRTSYKPLVFNIRLIPVLIRFSLRNKRGYRIVDYLFTLHLLGALYRLLVYIKPDIIPKFARKHAMGIGAIFR
jgi:hypothetical protein